MLKGTIDSLKKSLGKTGVFSKLINKFGLPKLEDDLRDHWTHPTHEDERKRLVLMLQDFSEKRRIRVTFIAGDVHCALAYAGMFFDEKAPNGHRTMIQTFHSVSWSIFLTLNLQIVMMGDGVDRSNRKYRNTSKL